MAQTEIPAAGQVQVTRTYRDSRTGAPLEQLRPGQLVRVDLTVELPEDAMYMLVEDKLPGGLEALNTELNTTSRVATAYEQTTFYWRSYGYNNKEVRSDRVSFFITEMSTSRGRVRNSSLNPPMTAVGISIRLVTSLSKPSSMMACPPINAAA